MVNETRTDSGCDQLTSVKNGLELLGEVFAAKLHFSCIKCSYSRDLESLKAVSTSSTIEYTSKSHQIEFGWAIVVGCDLKLYLEVLDLLALLESPSTLSSFWHPPLIEKLATY